MHDGDREAAHRGSEKVLKKDFFKHSQSPIATTQLNTLLVNVEFELQFENMSKQSSLVIHKIKQPNPAGHPPVSIVVALKPLLLC